MPNAPLEERVSNHGIASNGSLLISGISPDLLHYVYSTIPTRAKIKWGDLQEEIGGRQEWYCRPKSAAIRVDNARNSDLNRDMIMGKTLCLGENKLFLFL